MYTTQGTNDEIVEFGKKYGADQKFVYFDKGHVNGKDSREVYSFLKHKIPAADGTTDIRWNFATFLVDHEGKRYERFDPSMTVGTILTPKIEELIAKKEGDNSSTSQVLKWGQGSWSNDNANVLQQVGERYQRMTAHNALLLLHLTKTHTLIYSC